MKKFYTRMSQAVVGLLLLAQMAVLLVAGSCGTLELDKIDRLSVHFNAKAPSYAIVNANGENVCDIRSPNPMTQVRIEGYNCTPIDVSKGVWECLPINDLAKLRN